MIFKAEVKDGEIKVIDGHRGRFREFLLANEGEVLVNVEKPSKGSKQRTGSQNKLYWVYLELISNDTGHTAEELHEIFKRMFLPPQFLTFKDKEIKVPGSTKNLNKVTFGDYLDRISAETGIPIPDPADVGIIDDLIINTGRAKI